jgi:ankyrin repeat protein
MPRRLLDSLSKGETNLNMKKMIKPMQTAINKGDLKTISQFIEQGFPLNKLLFHGDNSTALHVAVDVGSRHKVIELLLAAGADPDVENDQFKETALHQACASGDLAAVKLLIEADANTDVEMESGITPIMLAAEAPKNGKEIVAVLLARGASVAPNKNGGNPLHSQITDPAIVDELIKAGADVNGSLHGITPLMKAVEKVLVYKTDAALRKDYKPQPKVMAALIAHGADSTAKFPRAIRCGEDAQGQSIIEYARAKKLPASVIEMLEAGVSSKRPKKSSVKSTPTPKRSRKGTKKKK